MTSQSTPHLHVHVNYMYQRALAQQDAHTTSAPRITLSQPLYDSLTGKQMQKSPQIFFPLQSQTVEHIFVFIGHRKGLDLTSTVFLLKREMWEVFFFCVCVCVSSQLLLLCLLVLVSTLRSFTPEHYITHKRQQHGWFANLAAVCKASRRQILKLQASNNKIRIW